MRRYRTLLIVVAVAALVLGFVSRLPRHAAPPPAPAAPAPVVEVAVTFGADGAEPERAQVTKDFRVRLTLANQGPKPIEVRLAGYEDRVAVAALAPGAVWRGEFLADRPGEAFAWLVNGEPRGRLAVAGSHLVEGHR